MALSENSTTIGEKESPYSMRQDFPVAAGAHLYQGAIVCIDADGFAVAGADTAGFVVIGKCEVEADNSSGADGDINVTVFAGIFGPYTNTGTTIAQTNVGTICGIVDDEAVTLAVTNIAAGRIYEVTDDGVFVAMIYPASSL